MTTMSAVQATVPDQLHRPVEASERWISACFACSILDYLEQQNIPCKPVLDRAGLTENSLRQRDSRISASTYVALLETAIDISGDPLLGFHAGQAIKPGHYGVLGYVMMSSETFGEALYRAKRFQHLIGDVGQSDIHISGELVEIRWQSLLRENHPQLMELHIAAIHSFARWMSNTNDSPLSIGFSHAPPADTREHEAFFGCEVQYHQAYNSVTIPRAAMRARLPQTDPTMRHIMDRYAENLLREYNNTEPFLAQVKAYLHRTLSENAPSVEAVAQRFNMTVRTLQRRLKQEGFNYKQLLDETRKELAIEYISRDDILLPDLAFLLGFSEQSSFQRAFKRWTGMPPGQYRRNRLNEMFETHP